LRKSLLIVNPTFKVLAQISISPILGDSKLEHTLSKYSITHSTFILVPSLNYYVRGKPSLHIREARRFRNRLTQLGSSFHTTYVALKLAYINPFLDTQNGTASYAPESTVHLTPWESNPRASRDSPTRVHATPAFSHHTQCAVVRFRFDTTKIRLTGVCVQN